MQFFEIVEGPNGDPLAGLRAQEQMNKQVHHAEASSIINRSVGGMFDGDQFDHVAPSEIFGHLAQLSNQSPQMESDGTMVFDSLEDALKFLLG